MSTSPLKTAVDISQEETDALTERLWEYGTVIGKAPSTQDAVCHDAAHMIEALRNALTASESLLRKIELDLEAAVLGKPVMLGPALSEVRAILAKGETT